MQQTAAGGRRAIVIGGSMGGLFAGLFLRKIGWQVDIFERAAADLSGRGAGIVTHEALFAAMSEAGVIVDRNELGVAVDGRITLDGRGEVLGRLRLPQILTAWDRLYRALREAFPSEHYHKRQNCIDIRPLAEGVEVRFESGRTERADLAVAADGIRSFVRQRLAPQSTPEYAGYIAWRGLVAEQALSAETREQVFDYFGFCMPENEQFVGYPVAGPDNDLRRGHRRYNFVWYRPAEERTELRRLLTDRNGHRHDLSIPPTLIRPELIREALNAAERLLAPAFFEVFAKTELPFIQPIYDLRSRNIAFGRVVLLGDAAFVARPHTGMGVTKAAEDASTLARCLQQHPEAIDQAVQAYAHSRTRVGEFIVDHGRDLGAYLQASQREHNPLAEHYSTPAAVMSDTAVASFMDDFVL